MKTHVLLGIVAFLVRALWVLLAKAGCILRLLVRVEAHPRMTLQVALTGAFRHNPFLGRSGKDQTKGSRSCDAGPIRQVRLARAR
jgi:hypothetical protein